MSLSLEEQYELITRNLDEVLNGQLLKDKLKSAQENNKPLSVYWGTATTGKPHIGYLNPLSKIADFLRAGLRVKILIADVHAFLDSMKSTMEQVEYRSQYYSRVIHSALKAIGVSTEKLEFITGSSYQYSPEYNRDKLKLCSITSEHDARKAGAEVVKQSDNAPLSSLLYPLLQALDEEYLGVDIQFGGRDQRKIFTFAQEKLPLLGYAPRVHLMNGMVPGLQGGKMSASEANSKIDLIDTKKEIANKVNKALAVEGNSEGNGLLAFAETVLHSITTLHTGDGRVPPFASPDTPQPTGDDDPRPVVFTILRKDEHGGPLHYRSFFDLRKDYDARELHPADLKLGIKDAITKLLAPIREEFENDPEFQRVEKLGYGPEPVQKPTKKKEKKVNPRFADAIAQSQKAKAEKKANVAQNGDKNDDSDNKISSSLKDLKESLPDGTAPSCS